MFLESAPYLDRLEGSDEVALSAQDIEQFKSQGFVVKHGLIDDPKAPLASARARPRPLMLSPARRDRHTDDAR